MCQNESLRNSPLKYIDVGGVIMKSISKKILCLCVPLTILFSTCLYTFAWSAIQGTSDWENLPGNMTGGQAKPSTVALTSNGLEVTYTGGEYVPGGSNAGVMYTKGVKLSDFSVSFKVNEAAGNYNLQGTGVDSWISICLLNKKDKYFNINKAGESQGLVVLIRPMEGKTAFEINMLTNSWATASRGAYYVTGNEEGKTFTFATKLNAGGTYDIYINDTKVIFTGEGGIGGNDLTKAFTTLMESNSAYLYMGNSSRTANQNFKYTITKINGTTVKGTAASSTSSSKSSSATVSGSVSSSKPASGSTTSSSSAASSNQAGSTVLSNGSESKTSGTSESEIADSTGSGSGIEESGAESVTESLTSDVSGASESEASEAGKGTSSGLPGAAVAGIVAGVVILAGAIAFFIFKKKA